MGQKDLMGEGLDQLLLALKIEERDHKPKNAAASRSWQWPSVYSQPKIRDLSSTTARN